MSISRLGDGMPISQDGDILTRDANGIAVLEKPAVTNQVLSPNSSNSTGLGWLAQPSAPAQTYSLIGSEKLTSASTYVTFSNIPQTYKTLSIYISSRDYNTAISNTNNMFMYFNNAINSTNKSVFYLYSTPFSISVDYGGSSVLGVNPSSRGTGNVNGMNKILIPNYSSSSYYKTAIFSCSASTFGSNNNYGVQTEYRTGSMTFQDFTPITSITFASNTGFDINSEFHLFGIKEA